ncbi:hypothetical protein [Burkholderia sp. Bp9099]|uniref:hypothetical protein n=1 Tax=Burkholderia sp. Bp9099 TaxID=2184568 RepID=UPI000F5EC830|nr:hypothetical protein [Burkholderia sp. Bp9099]RQZ40055.1 hypothetical protein DIE17_33195 [Burkholderia sp. Bp9099]
MVIEMANYAIVQNGTVKNVVVWDGNAAEWQPPNGYEAVLIPADTPAGIGYSYDGTQFSPPA